VLFSLPDDLAGLGLGAALVGVGIAARLSSKRLANGAAAAPGRLALGEIVLLFAIVLYALAKMTVMRTSGSELAQVVGALGSDVDIAELVETTTDVVYSAVILLAFLYQGGLALYFRARRSAVRRYMNDTPAWAREVVMIAAE
jgi:hypothetical protein